MILLELHKQPEFEAKLQKLMGTLKDQIKGRDDYEAYLPLEQAAAESGVSQELIRNVLEGRFIEKALGRIGAKLDTDHVIVIRRRFGRPGKRPPTPALQDLEDKYRNRSAQTGESEAAQRGVTVAPGEAGPPTKSATPGGVGGTAAAQAAKIITPTVEYQLGSIGRLAWVHVLAMDIPSGALVIFADDLVQLYNDKKIPDFSI